MQLALTAADRRRHRHVGVADAAPARGAVFHSVPVVFLWSALGERDLKL